MKKTMIRLSTIEDVRNFVNIVARYDCDIDLSSGRYIVDAKSIMGIFSLDLLNPIELTAHCESADRLFEEIKKFIVA
ncbi:MAG: HPr family phosphocarrier protein [Clostridiales bacterium]|nr:HPr family phosphocarrier protein [Clostridiales bacterium]